MDQGLMVLSVIFGVSAVTALVVAQRALSPYRHTTSGLARAPQDARAALRASALKSAAALAAAVTVAVGMALVATAASWEMMVAVLVIPVAATTIGLAVYAAIPGRPAPVRPTATALLAPRRLMDNAPRVLVALCGVLAGVLLVLLVAAAVQDTVFVTGQPWGLAVAAVATVGLVAAGWCALRRVAGQPALPTDMLNMDRTIRGSASRLILLLTSGALWASTATMAIALGYASTSWASVSAADGSPDQLLGAIGTGLTVAGVAAVIGALGSLVGAVTATLSLARASMAVSRAPRPAAVPA
ncbi:hypothetical protein IFT90_15390 [Frigoribacterium sp. CFBP 8766]|uniref:hypothetical protein n=1 Tax=Frigoribacterium sp. CFBP 8766 TaxID=2775273 RepID=UPI0017836A5A|nr:hypothetical protein [Frigoribacterium sp. CFBP 8766]MBD8585938.1 hypothetical protein [Frigoribacterium sp. CFBP 8766]